MYTVAVHLLHISNSSMNSAFSQTRQAGLFQCATDHNIYPKALPSLIIIIFTPSAELRIACLALAPKAAGGVAEAGH